MIPHPFIDFSHHRPSNWTLYRFNLILGALWLAGCCLVVGCLWILTAACQAVWGY